MFSWTKTFVHVWNYLRVSKWWQNFYFWWTIPLIDGWLFHLLTWHGSIQRVNIIVTRFVRRKEVDRVGSWRLGWFIKQINLNMCSLCASSVHQLSRLSQCSHSVFVLAVSRSQTMRPSLHSVSLLEFPLHGGFIGSVHANYCNQTQVFLILHLTHLFTAVSWVFLPLQTLLNHAPLATYPHRPTQTGKPSGLQPPHPSPPFLERKSATVISVPGLWITLNLKGCNARYQRVIRALVSFMRWSHCKGEWSEQRVNSRPRRW